MVISPNRKSVNTFINVLYSKPSYRKISYTNVLHHHQQQQHQHQQYINSNTISDDDEDDELIIRRDLKRNVELSNFILL